MRLLIKRYISPYYPRMGIGFVIKFIGTIMDLCIPYILAYIIDTVIPMQNRNRILQWGALMLLCSLLAVSFNIIANRMASKVARDVTEQVRHDLFAKTMYLSNAQTDRYTKPSLISRLTTDTYNIHQMIGRIQRLGVRAPILLLGGICVTFTLDPVMALVLLAVLPLLAGIMIAVSRRSIPMYGGLQEAVDRFVRMVREDIAGIRVIKALSKTEYETEKFQNINREVVRRERRTGMLMAVINPSMNVLLNLGLVCVILVGAFRVNNGTSEVGKILAFTTYFTIILNAMMSISKMFEIISKAVASADRIAQVMEAEGDMSTAGQPSEAEESMSAAWQPSEAEEDMSAAGQPSETEEDMSAAEQPWEAEEDMSAAEQPSEAEEGMQAAESVHSAGGNNGEQGSLVQDGSVKKQEYSQREDTAYEIVFDHVCFSYQKQEPDLQNISFQIRKGETLGIIGEIGSGKSTIVNLMMRLYDADSGRILIGGKDVRAWKSEALKAKFGVVFQNDTLFEDSIAGNVTLGRNLDEMQVKAALKYAQAQEFVEGRTDKEKEALNIKGANLSGGQKQRVLIARALAAGPEILILDDSSSALDYRTDAALRKGIRSLLPDTTLVIVAQRVSSIKNADHILVLEDGRMLGYGTHEELMQSCDVYREISESQLSSGLA